MPNRVIRDWTDSERVDLLSFQAEVLFIRLMMKADDYGSYHANPKLINSFCFPLKNIRETDISRWLQELASVGLIVLYTAENKQFLQIINFGQRLRQMKPKFPQISENELNNIMSANGQQPAVNCPHETETESETESEPPNPQKGNEIDFDKLLKLINDKTKREFKMINDSVKAKFKARIKDGYTKEDILNTINNASKDTFHIEKNFQYLTPEYLSRASTIDKHSSVSKTESKVLKQEKVIPGPWNV